MFTGPVEVDEVYLGGKSKNRHWNKRTEGVWIEDKMPVMGVFDRETRKMDAAPVPQVTQESAEAFILDRAMGDAEVYADGSTLYYGLPYRQSFNHSRREYVQGDAHINTMESFWALIRRAWQGVYHW